MDLNKLSKFMHDKRIEFETAVREEAKNLRLEDVTREIKLNIWEFTQRGFEDGQRLDFLFCQGNYHGYIDREELILRGNYGIEVARFSGDGMKNFYEGLSKTILKDKEEEDVPF